MCEHPMVVMQWLDRTSRVTINYSAVWSRPQPLHCGDLGYEYIVARLHVYMHC